MSTPAPPARFRAISEQNFVAKMAEPNSPMRVAVDKAIKDFGAGIPAGAGPAVRLTSIPGTLANQRRDQQSTYSQDNVTTAPDGTWYSVTLDERQHSIVRKWSASNKLLQEFDLHGMPGNPFGPQGDDSHNTGVVGVDHLGNILAAINTRGTSARIAVTTTPGDLSTFTFLTNPLPAAFDSLSYPTFVRKANGRLAYAAGQGYAAGGRNWFWAEWTGSAFAAPQILLDGISSGEGAYLSRFAIRGNVIALWFMWRSGTTGDGNRDIGLAISRDAGVTWQKPNGAAQQMPITHANAATVIPFEAGAGVLNQGGAGIDNDGHPHAAFMFYDTAGKTQIHHVWHDGSSLHNEKVTSLTQRMDLGTGTIAELSVARPQLFCTNDGRTIILARITYDGYGGRPLGIDVTPGADRTPFRLADLDLAGWEPAFDERAIREHNTLRMLVTSIDHAKSSKKGWIAQWGGILSVDLDRIGELQAGLAPIPTIRTVAAYSIPTEIAVVANTATDTAIPALGQLTLSSDQYEPGRVYFARASGTFDIVSDTRTDAVRADDVKNDRPGVRIAFTVADGGGEVCQLNLVQQAQAGSRATPWEPIPITVTAAAASARRSLALSAHGLSGASVGGARVRAFRFELGVLSWTT